jgi:hypothetical protein
MASHYKKILENLSKEFAIEKFWGQTVFKINRVGFLYLRYSKRFSGDKYFFGVETNVINQIKESLYTVIFVCGDESKIIIVPSDLFKEIIKDVQPAGNQWKINIFFTGEKIELKISGKDRIDVTKYLNNTDFILSKVYFIKQKIPYKEIDYELIKKRLELKKDEKIIKTELLIKRLEEYASLSEKPAEFENVISDVFEEFGFKCKHIGGSGNTDVLAKSEYSIILEAKSTKRASINKINFTRLKQHKKKHKADYIVIIAKDFDPAVVRDSEIENSVLLPVNILTELLKINKQYTIHPNIILGLFKKSGIIKNNDLIFIKNEYQRWKTFKNGLLLLLATLDRKNGKTSEELKGAINSKLEMKHSVKDFFQKDEIEKMLSFLQISPLKIVNKENNKFIRAIDLDNSKRLLNSFFEYVKKVKENE